MRKNFAKLLIVAVAMMTMVGTVSAASDTATQTVSTSVGSAISISAANVTIPGITAGGAAQTGTGNLSVNTNSAAGFNVTAENNDGAATSLLDHTVDGDDIADKTAWNSSTQNAAAWTGTGTAFRVVKTGTYASAYADADWGSDDTTNALYAGMPANGATNNTIANSSAAEDNSVRTIVVEFKVATVASQKSGNYDGTVLYTATTN